MATDGKKKQCGKEHKSSKQIKWYSHERELKTDTKEKK